MPDPKEDGIVVDDVRESVRAAYEEVSKQTPEPAPIPAPEAEPAKEPELALDETRPRGPDGKFVKKDDAPQPAKEVVLDKPGTQPVPQPADTKAPPAQAQQPGAAPSAGPPPSWSIAAKTEWDAFSKQFPTLAAEIAKRENDVSQGFREYSGLKPFVERARQSNRLLPEVISAYVNMEDTLRRDPRSGLLAIAQNIGWTQHQAGQAFLNLARDLGVAPNGSDAQPSEQPPQGGFDPSFFAPVIQPLVQRLDNQERLLTEWQRAQAAAQTQPVAAALDAFASDPANRYFKNVEDSIARLFETGEVQKTGNHAADLKRAYLKACWANDDIRPVLIKEQMAKEADEAKARDLAIAQKAKAASKSITGSPAPGVVPGTQGQGDSVEEAARAAYRQHAMQ